MWYLWTIFMREMVILGFCAVIALIVVWSLLRAFRTGRISSRGWTFQVDENPGGFFFVAFCDVLILAGCIWFALHTLGWVGDLRIQLTR